MTRIATKYPNFEQPYEAYDDSAICPQLYPLNNSVIGSLDCLRLNIYVPLTVSSTNRLPVMIWIYGGAFQRGYSCKTLYGPEYLVRHDVIVVTISHRVGPYGFMCLHIPEIPGNQGLKDQYIAMRWVYDNIGAFGGDRSNITLFGMSSGAYSSELHLRSQMNEIFFNKIIMESGTALAATAFKEPDKEAPMKLAEYLGFNTTNLHEALAFLTSSEPKSVVDAAIKLKMSFKTCVEKIIDGVDSFITTTWVDKPVPRIKNMPVLLGFNKDERMVTYINVDSVYFKNVFKDRLQLTYDFSESEWIEVENLLRHFYIGDELITEDVVWGIINFDSDYTYIHPIYRNMKQFIASGAGNIYYYMFSYSGGRNYSKNNANITIEGTAHTDEIGYLFDMMKLPDPSDTDKLVVDRMTEMWTNFAKYSDPIPKKTDLLPVKWPPVTAETFYCMKIDSNLTLIRRPLHERMAFWDLFYKTYKKSLKKFFN